MGMKIENFRFLPDADKWDYVEKVLDSLLTDVTAVNAELTKTNTDLDQHDVAGDAMNRFMQYLCLSPAGLTIGSGDAKKVKITNTVVFTSAGVFKSKSTAEVDFTATTHDIVDGKFACFLVSLAADGTPHLTKGADAASAALAIAAMPACPASETPIGYLTLGASGAIFNATTDELSAGHLTDVYYDLSVVPQLLPVVTATTMDAATLGTTT